jgi:type IV pilus assembly protein PilA
MRNAKGVTLIELMIVIGIIGMLMSVLLPNLIGARRRTFDAAAMGCARTVALVAETHRVNGANLNYTFTASDVSNFDPRSCSGIRYYGSLPNNSPTFSLTVFHQNGTRAYQVVGEANGVTITQVGRPSGSHGSGIKGPAPSANKIGQ